MTLREWTASTKCSAAVEVLASTQQLTGPYMDKAYTELLHNVIHAQGALPTAGTAYGSGATEDECQQSGRLRQGWETSVRTQQVFSNLEQCPGDWEHSGASHLAALKMPANAPTCMDATAALHQPQMNSSKARRNSWVGPSSMSKAMAPPDCMQPAGKVRRHSALLSQEWHTGVATTTDMHLNLSGQHTGTASNSWCTSASAANTEHLNHQGNPLWTPQDNPARVRRSSAVLNSSELHSGPCLPQAPPGKARRNSAVTCCSEYYGSVCGDGHAGDPYGTSSLPAHLLLASSRVRRNSTSVLTCTSNPWLAPPGSGHSNAAGMPLPLVNLPSWQKQADPCSMSAAMGGMPTDPQPPIKVRRLSDLEASLLYGQARRPRATSLVLPPTTSNIDMIHDGTLLASLSACGTPAAYTPYAAGMLGAAQHTPSHLGTQPMHYPPPQPVVAQQPVLAAQGLYQEPLPMQYWLDDAAFKQLLWSEMLCAAAANEQLMQQATLQVAHELSSMSLQNHHHHHLAEHLALQHQQRLPDHLVLQHVAPQPLQQHLHQTDYHTARHQCTHHNPTATCHEAGLPKPHGKVAPVSHTDMAEAWQRQARDSSSGSSCATPGGEQLAAAVPEDVMGPPRAPSVYTDMINAQALLDANRFMCRIKLPGRLPYVVVDINSIIFRMGAICDFSASTICLASSYFQRLVEVMPNLEVALRAQEMYKDYTAGLPVSAAARAATPASNDSSTDKVICCVQFTCLFIAAKVNEIRSRHTKMLQAMLSQLAGSFISLSQANQVEVRCLEGLGWRLGPYYAQDQLDLGMGPEDMSPLPDIQGDPMPCVAGL